MEISGIDQPMLFELAGNLHPGSTMASPDKHINPNIKVQTQIPLELGPTCPPLPNKLLMKKNLKVNRGDMDNTVKKKYPFHFQKAWKDDPEFSPWLREVACVCPHESGEKYFFSS